MEVLLSILGGSFGAAIATGVFSIIQKRQERKYKQSDKDDAQTKALRYIMLYIIQERAKEYIKEKKVTLEDRRSLHHWHKLYHDGLGGNGDADALMAQVDKLPVDLED